MAYTLMGLPQNILFRRSATLLALLLMGILHSGAQAQNCYTTFKINIREGCAPLDLTVTSHVSNENPIYDYGDGTVKSAPFHTYAKGGLYRVVRVISPRCTSTVSDTLFVRVYDKREPLFSVTACEAKQLRLIITDTIFHVLKVNLGNGDTARLLKGDTLFYTYSNNAPVKINVQGVFLTNGPCGDKTVDFSPINTLDPGKITQISFNKDSLKVSFSSASIYKYERYLEESVNGRDFVPIRQVTEGSKTVALPLHSPDSVYCYRLTVKAPCDGKMRYTEALCTQPFQVQAKPGLNELNWGAYPINPIPDTLWLIRGTKDTLKTYFRSGNAQEYADDDIFCGKEYCYTLKYAFSGGRAVQMPTKCVKAVFGGKASEPTFPLATISGDSLKLSWGFTSHYIRSIKVSRFHNGLSDSVKLVNDSTLVDMAFDWKKETACYLITVNDSCNNIAVSDTICAVFLEGEKEGENSLLSWTPYRPGGGSYILERLDNKGNLLSEVPLGNKTSYLELMANIPRRVSYYRIRAQVLGAQTSYSNIISLEEQIIVTVPDAFTPNADGLNDTLEAWGKNIDTFNMDVYNRLGMKLFTSSQLGEFWDGLILGEEAPESTYTYIIYGLDRFGEPYKAKGTAILVRP